VLLHVLVNDGAVGERTRGEMPQSQQTILLWTRKKKVPPILAITVGNNTGGRCLRKPFRAQLACSARSIFMVLSKHQRGHQEAGLVS